MTGAWLALWLVSCAPTIERPDLPAPFAELALPTEGTTLRTVDGDKVVLHTPRTTEQAAQHWVDGLVEAGWDVHEPAPGPGFVRLTATRPPHELKVYVVPRKGRVEVHLTLRDVPR